MASDLSTLFAEGRESLRRLFGIAVGRLRERGIRMKFDTAAIEWLLQQSDWQALLNPLRTLDGAWDRRVANVIEGLLLDGRLRTGDVLWVGISDAPTSELRFVVSSPASQPGQAEERRCQ